MFIKGLTIFWLQLTLAVSVVYANTPPLRMPNLELPIVRHAQLIGPLNPQEKITFTVWLNLRNKSALKQFVNDVYDSKSEQYQKFLTQEEFNAHYAPSSDAINAVSDYFSKQGMETETVYSNIRVTATAKQIERVFNIKMNRYRYHQQTVYGNDTAPLIQSDIAPYVAGISGLSNIPYAHPARRHHLPKKSVKPTGSFKPQVLALAGKSFHPQALPTTTSLQGFTGADLRTTYKLASIPAINGETIDGKGQTIVIIDGCGNATVDDIIAFCNQYNEANGLPLISSANFAVVKPDGSPYTNHCTNPSGWDGEIMLDVQASHTIAPGANIVLVLTDNVRNEEVAETINYILDNTFTIGGFSNAYVISNSWDNDDERAHELLETPLQTAASRGMSINFAAGDCGDQTYNSSWPCSRLSATPSIQYPVSSAYVTAVSGTSLFVDANWNYAFESGWGTLVGSQQNNGSFYSGSMGGISKFQSFPSWQAPISGFEAGGYGTVGNTHRAIPDIAMLGDLYTGLLTYSEGGCTPCWDGGASLATPLFSGALTLVNQARALLAGRANPIGLAAPYFYLNNNTLIRSRAINLITPPHQIISGAVPASGGPTSAFVLYDSFFSQYVTFNWDSSLTIVEDQFWNDVVGVGSPNIPNFVQTMAIL